METANAAFSFELGATIGCSAHPGIAFRVRQKDKVWVPFTFFDLDEDGEEIEIVGDDGEWEQPEYTADDDELVATMVGDDHRWKLNVKDCWLLEEDDFCHECGQVGCGHGSL